MLVGLDNFEDPHGQECQQEHRGQTDVEAPEGDLRQPIVPSSRLDQAPPGEESQRQRQHSVRAEEGCVSVVRREVGGMLVVVDDRQVDHEPEDARAEEVPEGGGDEEHERPSVGELPAGLGDCPVLHPRTRGQQHQGDRLQ